MIEGLMIVLSGFSLKNAFSPNSFVLQLQVSQDHFNGHIKSVLTVNSLRSNTISIGPNSADHNDPLHPFLLRGFSYILRSFLLYFLHDFGISN